MLLSVLVAAQVHICPGISLATRITCETVIVPINGAFRLKSLPVPGVVKHRSRATVGQKEFSPLPHPQAKKHLV